jgi:hypothetical protein
MTFEILAIIILLNVVATIELWRRAARRPEKTKRKFRNRLWRSKPITPKHEPPPPLKKGYAVGEGTLQFFSDFEDFADVVNSWLTDPNVHPHNSPWRVQELPKSDLLELWEGSGPTYGRTYAVFHNQVRLGEIEIRPDRKYSTENPRVTVHVELDWVRLLHFERIRSFLTDIAMHISEYRPDTLEYVRANQQINLAMTRVLWKTQEISQYGLEPDYGEIEVELNGLASFYLDRRQALRNQAANAQAAGQDDSDQAIRPQTGKKIMRVATIIILAILAGFVAGIIKGLFPALHDVPTQAIIILTAFVVGVIILLFQRARGTLHDDHWAKDQLKNK